ncbi:MAG: hypothetical protein RLZZ200_1493 [Pseudomonadota bacterium]|jgi:DNA-binding NarL/FixJ family response regulator
MTVGKEERSAHKVLVVEDHPLFREALVARLGLEPGVSECLEAASVQEARRMLLEHDFAAMVTDISLTDGTGLDLIRRMRAEGHRMPVLVVSALDESVYGERAFRAGAQGFVHKLETPARIIEALHAVLSGGLYLSQVVSRAISQSSSRSPGESGNGIESLSDREMQIYSLLGQGQGTREIAERLFLSPHTVESHRERIRAKLGLRNSMALVQSALRWSLEEGGLLRGADPDNLQPGDSESDGAPADGVQPNGAKD